jgi:hypothetical protein
MRFTRLFVPPLCAAACAAFAISVGQASHPATQDGKRPVLTRPQVVTLNNVESVRLTRATSLKNVQKVRTELLEGLDTLISARAQGGETTLVNTKVIKEAVDKTVYKTTNSNIRMAALPEADLRELRAIIGARFEESIRAGRSNAIGEGQVNKSLFTGKIMAPAAERR